MGLECCRGLYILRTYSKNMHLEEFKEVYSSQEKIEL